MRRSVWQTASINHMTSHSIRISADLFVSANEEALHMSRSAAQQLEHWARLGRALERAGLSVDQARELLGESPARFDGRVPAAELWRFKRDQQARDLQAVASGARTPGEMSWFTPEAAARAIVRGEPF